VVQSPGGRKPCERGSRHADVAPRRSAPVGSEDDLVHFVINAVETMKLPALNVNERGSGSKQYPPRVMLALLIYCYANAFSARVY